MTNQRTTYASLKLTEQDHKAYEKKLQDFPLGCEYAMYLSGRACFQHLTRNAMQDRNPADKTSVVSVFREANYQDVETAVNTAFRALSSVKEMGWERRLEILLRARPIIERMKYNIAAVLTLEIGKTRNEAMAEACEVTAMIDAYEQFLTQANFYRYDMADGSKEPYERSTISMEPFGPVPVIVPFNFPFALCANMSMAAFLAGNPVIIKPPEDAPLASLLWRNILIEAGAPEEAILFLPGGGEVGKILAEHPSRDIGRIAFTGSAEVGMEINLTCANLAKQGINRRVIAELGSKNPVIVTRNADLKKAASGIMRSATSFSGQKCSATSRVYADKSVKEELIAYMTDPSFLAPFRIGNPRERGIWIGPLINEQAYNRYQRIVAELKERSKAEKIQVMELCDSESAEKDYISEIQRYGYYVVPIMATGIDHGDRLAQEEHFVPFVTIHEIDSLREGVDKANDTKYGLCAGFFSEDPDEKKYFQENIKFGVTYINRALGATSGSWPTIQSFGGWGMSGLGGFNAFGPWYPLLFAREQCATDVLK